MVRDDLPPGSGSLRSFLLNGDYDIAIALSLEVNDTGGLSPALSYMNAISGGTFTFAANGTLSESRDHNFTENLQFALRGIYVDWKYNGIPYDCPDPNTNLAGTLGLKDFVAMAALSPGLNESKAIGDSGGVFGGTIKFLVTNQIGTFGPTWSLVNFTGPGALASVSEVNTDQITVAFAQGTHKGTRIAATGRFNPTAHQFLQQLILQNIRVR